MLYLVGGMVLVGLTIEALSSLAGDAEVGTYEHHFAPGVGAVFGATK